MSDTFAMPPTETIEAVLRAVLREHYKASCTAWGGGWEPNRRTGFWTCACGAHGDVNRGERPTLLHRAHVAKVAAVALRGGVA